MWLFCYFYSERNYDVLKSKSPYFLLNKNKKFNKNEMKWKWKILNTVLERWNMCFSSYKNRKLKKKTVMSWSSRKKKKFCVALTLSEGDCFNICLLFQCIVYWKSFRNIYTFTCLFLELSKAFSMSLMKVYPKQLLFE